ncbi:hypothetical protein AKJ16_DCAP19069 [Drosera capensis]
MGFISLNFDFLFQRKAAGFVASSYYN